MNLIGSSKILMAAALVLLVAPVFAELPSDAVNSNRDDVNISLNKTIMNPMDPGYVWGNPLAIDLTRLGAGVFDSAAFSMDQGDLSAMYTTSINDFSRDNPNEGASNATRKAAKVGLVHWQK